MDLDVPFTKFKILFINLFVILYKAATLNPSKLQQDLREIEALHKNRCDVLLLPQLLILIIQLLIMAKFFFGYISLAANVIAIFPIISDDQPELLLPTMVSQAVENILLSLIEILLSYVTVKYYIPGKMSIFAIFMAKMIIKMSLSVSTLNIYSDLYNQIKFHIDYGESESSFEPDESNELFLQKQALEIPTG